MHLVNIARVIQVLDLHSCATVVIHTGRACGTRLQLIFFVK